MVVSGVVFILGLSAIMAAGHLVVFTLRCRREVRIAELQSQAQRDELFAIARMIGGKP